MKYALATPYLVPTSNLEEAHKRPVVAGFDISISAKSMAAVHLKAVVCIALFSALYSLLAFRISDTKQETNNPVKIIVIANDPYAHTAAFSVGHWRDASSQA